MSRTRVSSVLIAPCVVLSLSAATAVHGVDLIDTARLGDRGVVLENHEVPTRKGLEDARGVGDVDVDGFDDVVVIFNERPAPELESETPVAAAILIYGKAGLTGRHALPETGSRSAIFRVGLEEPWVRFREVRPMGDVNGDGLDDFGFGAESYPGGGRIFLIYGGAGLEGDFLVDDVGREGLAGVVFSSTLPGAGGLGRAFGPIGDFNGDGREDLGLGAFGTDYSGPSAGVVYVLLDAANLSAEVDLAGAGETLPGLRILGVSHLFPELGGVTDGDFFGIGLGAAGDFDGDGLDDFLAGGNTIRGGHFPSTTYLVFGRGEPPPELDLAELGTNPELGITAFSGHGGYESWFAGVGDVNGDGLDDIALSDPGNTNIFEPADGVVYILHGRPELPAQVPFEDLEELAAKIRPFGRLDRFGTIASAGDLNLDGIPDLLIGARGATRNGERDVGEAYAVFLPRDLPGESRLRDGFDGSRLLGEGLYDNFGSAVAPAGDFNGDGSPDYVVLAPYRGSGARPPGAGKAYVVYGFGSGPPPFSVLEISPDFGSVEGGTEVAIRGSGFRGSPLVLFGGNPATAVRLRSESELVALTPPGAAIGAVGVEVSIEGLTRRLAGGFEYTRPLPEIDLADLGRRGLVIEGPPGSRLGGSIALGDLTGDGVAEIALSASTGESWAVTMIRGGGGLPARVPGLVPSGRASVLLSRAPVSTTAGGVSVLGDVNGDGLQDLGIATGVAGGYILFGRERFAEEMMIEDELLLGRAVRIERGSSAESALHFTAAGDVTGDGVGDFAIASAEVSLNPDPDGPLLLFGSGEVLYVAGRRAWPEVFDLDVPAFVEARISGAPGQSLGQEFTAAGDVNGDGLPDLLVGSRSPAVSGPAYVFYGSRDLPAAAGVDSFVEGGGGVRIEIGLELFDGTSSTNIPQVGKAGDVDADGFDDLLLSVPGGGESFEGRSYLVPGGPGLPSRIFIEPAPETPDPTVSRIRGEGSQTYSGSPAPAGDFDGDGHDDFLLRAGDISGGFADIRGMLYLVFGEAERGTTLELGRLRGKGLRIASEPGSTLWLPADESGDLNGDGRTDFAFTVEKVPLEEGEELPSTVYVIYGLGSSAFVRGEVNLDDRLDISDGIGILGFLFLGSGPLRCEDAADVDDDGSLSVSDAIFLFNHLFLGGRPPPPPYPEAGEDPTEDALGCRGF